MSIKGKGSLGIRFLLSFCLFSWTEVISTVINGVVSASEPHLLHVTCYSDKAYLARALYSYQTLTNDTVICNCSGIWIWSGCKMQDYRKSIWKAPLRTAEHKPVIVKTQFWILWIWSGSGIELDWVQRCYDDLKTSSSKSNELGNM
jgi:hypothetical protein